MRRSALVFLFALAAPVMAQDWKYVVLKASGYEDDGAGNLIIELASGARLEVPLSDFSRQWSEAVAEAIQNQKATKTARSSAEPPSDAAAAPMIRSKCSQDWPDDFQMQKYCQDQQREALRALRGRQMRGGLARIRSKCVSDWPDDFQMRDYCESQQLEALRDLAD